MTRRWATSCSRRAAYIIPFIATFIAWSLIWNFADKKELENVYNLKLQLAFFTAFLTVGSFLMAMKSFILVRLKDDVYGHDRYRERYLAQNDYRYKGNYYEGLLDLGNLLSLSVFWAFVASMAQISLGFLNLIQAKITAISLGIGLLVIVLVDWWFVYRNLIAWFSFIEYDKKMQIDPPESEVVERGFRG